MYPMLCRAALICLAVAITGAGAAAQHLRMERHSYAHLQRLRFELLQALDSVDAAGRARIAQALADDLGHQPFAAVGDALAIAAGQEPDEETRVRAGIMMLALPEIVDQDKYRQLHVTMRAPRKMSDRDDCSFELALFGEGEDALRTAVIREQTRMDDLLRARPTTAFDLDGLDPGAYRVSGRVLLADSGPREWDAALRARVWILPGFKPRADDLPMQFGDSKDVAERAAGLFAKIPESRRDPLSRAVLAGALWQVDRVYRAEPAAPRTDPIGELETAERIYANLCADRDALHGIEGRVVIGVPADTMPGEEGAAEEICVLSLELPKAGVREPRPLCLFVPGAPAWNARAQRPQTPRSTMPAWMLEELRLGGFGLDSEFRVVVLESPGRLSSAVGMLQHASAWLPELLPLDPERSLWVGEREGAYAVSRATVAAEQPPSGMVLIAGGMLTPDELRSGELPPMLLVPAQGHSSVTVVERMLAQAGEASRIEALPAEGICWPIATGQRAEAIERFARELLAD